VSEVGVTSFIDFGHRCKFAADTTGKVRTTVFRRQNSTFRKRFLDIGLRSSVAVPH